MQQEEDWSNIISSRSTFSFHSLKDVWQYRDLLWMFVKRDIVTNYKQTVLGPLWFFIQPALTTALFVFMQRAGNFKILGLHPILYNLIGVISWGYFAECLTKTSTTFKDNAFIFGKVYFPRLILPLSIVFSSLIKFFIQVILFVITAVVLLLMHKTPIVDIQTSILLLPLLIIIMAGLGLGGGLIVTSLTTKYRDLALLVQFGIQLLMYATLTVPISATKGVFHTFLKFNPMMPIIETFRQAFYTSGSPDFRMLSYSAAVMLVLLFIGFYIFSNTEKTFTDNV